jgi:hypothetical protein
MNTVLTNPWVFIACVIWLSCGAVGAVSKKSTPIEYAVVASVLMGVFYCIVHRL